MYAVIVSTSEVTRLVVVQEREDAEQFLLDAVEAAAGDGEIEGALIEDGWTVLFFDNGVRLRFRVSGI